MGPSCDKGSAAAIACVAASYTRYLVILKGSSRSRRGVRAEYSVAMPPSA